MVVAYGYYSAPTPLPLPFFTKDILYVMKMLDHKNIQNPLIYTQLITFESDEYHSAVAKTIDEARALVEEGFHYVCTHNDAVLFRKRK